MKAFDHGRIRSLRYSKDYSLEMMARLLRVRCKRRITRSAISHWERGLCAPNLESLAALSELFGVPVDYFFTDQSNNLFDTRAKRKKEEKEGDEERSRAAVGPREAR